MCDLGFKICRQVDDLNSTKGTFFDTNTTTDTEVFRDESNLTGRSDLNTELTSSNNRACFSAFLSALFWFTLVFADDCDSI